MVEMLGLVKAVPTVAPMADKKADSKAFWLESDQVGWMVCELVWTMD